MSLLVFATLAGAASGQTEGPGPSRMRISTNEAFIRDARTGRIDLANVQEVFAMVFAQIPESAFVYPTENYYYFRFFANGREVSGNLRLDAEDRDAGLLDFAYFAAAGRPEKPSDLELSQGYKQLGAAQGVVVTRRGPLRYDVAYRGRTVAFQLNDLSQAELPAVHRLPSEVFVERTCDDSGFQFALLFDTIKNAFRFVLDESVPLPDVLQELAPRFVVGRLSGFVFFEDKARRRKVLVGVDADNMRRNNYWDGPFDQLADNFVPASLKDYMEKAYPYARGRIDRRGCFKTYDGRRSSSRLALTPFQTYNGPAELRALVTAVVAAHPDDADLIAVLTHDYKQDVPGAPPEGAPAVSPVAPKKEGP